MSCFEYAPLDIPSNPVAPWFNRFTANLLNDICLNVACGPICAIPGAVTGSACTSCLRNSGCNDALGCIECIGAKFDFDAVYPCAQPFAWPWWQIMVVVIGTLLGLLVAMAVILLVMYQTNKLSIHNRQWVEEHLYQKHVELTSEQLLEWEREKYEATNAIRKIKLRRKYQQNGE